MKDYNQIDELIRQKFEGFEPTPPDAVWEKVKGQIGPDTSSPKGNPITLPIITGLIILVGLIGLLFLISRMEATMPVQASSGETYFDNAHLNNSFNTNQQVANASFNLDNHNSSLDQKNNSERIITNSIPVRKPFDGQPAFNTSTINDDASREVAHAEILRQKNRKQDLRRFYSESWRLDGKSFNGQLTGAGDTGGELYLRSVVKPGGKEDYVLPTKPSFTVGFYFNPEVSFYPTDDISNALNYSFQVLPNVNFRNWYLRSGLGLRTGGDNGNYLINYNKFLGSYEDVYDVTFDSTENGVVPIYHTQSVDVYDTVPYYSISEAKARYSYLDVPLMVGYRWSFNRVSLFLNAGPSISILLGQSNPAGDYPEENIRILNEGTQIPAREQINWQMVAGAGFGYSFSDKVSLSLEPTFRYYLSNDYKDNNVNARPPYAFGIRAGLIYHFNH